MILTNLQSSPFGEDLHKRAAAEVLVELLQHQQIEVYIAQSSGTQAAEFCADFIETFAERLKKMSAT